MSVCGYCGADHEKVVSLTTGKRSITGTIEAARKAVRARDKPGRYMLLVCPACGTATDIKEG